MRIITHPNNLDLLKQNISKGEYGDPVLLSFTAEIITSEHMDQCQKTGRYILPDGRTVSKEQVYVPWDRFTEWEPKDIPWLLSWGIIHEEQEPLFIMMDDSALRFRVDDMPLVLTPSFFVKNIS